jgi:hypothetical protein
MPSAVMLSVMAWHHATQHDDTEHNDIQHYDTEHSDIQHNDTRYRLVFLSVISTECRK